MTCAAWSSTDVKRVCLPSVKPSTSAAMIRYLSSVRRMSGRKISYDTPKPGMRSSVGASLLPKSWKFISPNKWNDFITNLQLVFFVALQVAFEHLFLVADTECNNRHKQQRTDRHYSQDELRQGLKEQFEGHGIYDLAIYNLAIFLICVQRYYKFLKLCRFRFTICYHCAHFFFFSFIFLFSSFALFLCSVSLCKIKGGKSKKDKTVSETNTSY